MPKWYKDLSPYVGDEKKFRPFAVDGGVQANITIKWCTPVLDAFSLGYMAVLSNDVFVKPNLETGIPDMTWGQGGPALISTHSLEQITKEQIPKEYVNQPYKFANDWSLEAPKGYSILYTHPLNRSDLPFHTLSGFVDNDSYLQPVNFPFIIKKDFEGVIEAGTPIAQIIPIKRELWSHKFFSFDPSFVKKTAAKFATKIYRSYKSNYWSRKSYQ